METQDDEGYQYISKKVGHICGLVSGVCRDLAGIEPRMFATRPANLFYGANEQVFACKLKTWQVILSTATYDL